MGTFSDHLYLGFLYFIDFVDEFCAYLGYHLKDHIDVLPTILQFLQEVSTQYSTIPIILCIDKALELIQTSLHDL